MLLGSLVVVLLAFGVRRARRSKMVLPAVAVLMAVGGVVVLALSAFDDTRGKFASGDLSKLDLIKSSFGLLRTFAVFGLGRGAFESTYPKVRTAGEYWVDTHPENLVAQWVAACSTETVA